MDLFGSVVSAVKENVERVVDEGKQLLEEVRLENIKLSKSIGNLESSMLSTMNERQSQVAKNVVDMSIIRESKPEKSAQSKDLAAL